MAASVLAPAQSVQSSKPDAPAHDPAHHSPEHVGPSKPEDVEADVRRNVVAQSIGPATIADLKLPEDFLRRVTDRVVRASYEERYRIIVRDDTASTARTPAPPPASTWSRMIWIGVGALAVTLMLTVWTQRRKAAQ
ncbi:MAG: hypothetical protein ACKVWV_17060 [Planctomycetota bacterium]